MKVLILSCNTGEGHNSCAKALTERFTAQGIPCETIDALAFISPGISKLMSKGHVFIYRNLPGVFDWGYRFSEKHSFFYRKGAPLYAFFACGSKKLARYINENDYDTVICAHVFAGVMMTEAVPMCRKKLFTSFLTTDYTCSPITEVSNLDLYFIPDERVKKHFTGRGMDEKKLITTGIPIRSDFYTRIPKAEAKAAENIHAEHKHLVIMCGSMGCGPIRKIVNSISGRLSSDMEMTVVCGNNRNLYRQLSALQENHPNIHIRGYVQNISRLMDSADVYLTKPGGISVTEASTKQLPMVLVNAVGGCEQYNYDFFTGIGAAESGDSVEKLMDKCLELLNHPEKREQICQTYTPDNAAERIVRYMMHVYEDTYQYLTPEKEVPEEERLIREEEGALLYRF